MARPTVDETLGTATQIDVLLVDDEPRVLELYAEIIRSMGHVPHTAPDAKEGIALCRKVKPRVVIVDLVMPGDNGLELLRQIKEAYPDTRVVMVTGYSTVEVAVEAMKLGAHDCISKPFRVANLIEVLRSALKSKTGRRPVDGARPSAASGRRVTSYAGLVGISSSMRKVFELIRKASESDSTVLIEGESGTGKELVARAVHSLGPRAKEAFVPVDCGAISPNLIESELFGHEAGAFTDARNDRPGLLRAASKGTVFLDEIGELSLSAQVKLLRALQEGEVRPVGKASAEPFEARVIAATNRDLIQEVAEGRFRRDLFYRLYVLPIYVAPLRERREDVPVTARHFLEKYGRKDDRVLTITQPALKALMEYDWPGNVRELENCVQRAYAFIQGEAIDASDVPLLLPRRLPREGGEPEKGTASLQVREEEALREAMAKTNGNKREAARLLNISIATFYRKLKRYGIS